MPFREGVRRGAKSVSGQREVWAEQLMQEQAFVFVFCGAGTGGRSSIWPRSYGRPLGIRQRGLYCVNRPRSTMATTSARRPALKRETRLGGTEPVTLASARPSFVPGRSGRCCSARRRTGASRPPCLPRN